MSAIEQLRVHLGGFRSAPFLFVGSGLSRRYLGLDAWDGLLERMAALTERPYGYYVSRGESSLPDVATEIAKEFFDVWWDEQVYEVSRDEHASRMRGRESPLKIEVARYVDSGLEALPKRGQYADELAALSSAVVDGVITTNYDRLMEAVLPDFRVFVGQDELLFSDPQGVGEIYKIHGSSSRPDSLVLTRSDFDSFEDRNPYLAAKLLTVFVEHPVIFLGYSLSDPNITQILVSIARVLTTENIDQLRDRLIFVQWDPDVREATYSHTVVAVDGFTIPVVNVRVGGFVELFQMLGGLPRQFPARLLRRLKERVYELVLENKPTGRLAVVDIEEDSAAADIDVVFGVGVREQLGLQGYVGLNRQDLLSDVLRPDSAYRPDGALEALPGLQGNVPIYRYLRAAGLLTEGGKLVDGAQVHDRIRTRVAEGGKRFLPAPSARKRAKKIVKRANSDIYQLAATQNVNVALLHFSIAKPSDVDFEQLRRFLIENAVRDGSYASAWAKLVCFYDYYTYGDIAHATAAKDSA